MEFASIFLSDIVCGNVLFDTEKLVGSLIYPTVCYPGRLFALCFQANTMHTWVHDKPLHKASLSASETVISNSTAQIKGFHTLPNLPLTQLGFKTLLNVRNSTVYKIKTDHIWKTIFTPFLCLSFFPFLSSSSYIMEILKCHVFFRKYSSKKMSEMLFY